MPGRSRSSDPFTVDFTGAGSLPPRGRLVLALPEFGRGTHFLRVALAGNPSQHAAASAYRMLRIR